MYPHFCIPIISHELVVIVRRENITSMGKHKFLQLLQGKNIYNASVSFFSPQPGKLF